MDFFPSPLCALARGCHCDRLGIQIAQLAIIGTQLSMVLLSIVLLIGIHKVSEVLLFITSNWFWLNCLFPFNLYIFLLSSLLLLLLLPLHPLGNFIKIGKCQSCRSLHRRLLNAVEFRNCCNGMLNEGEKHLKNMKLILQKPIIKFFHLLI